MVKLLLLLLLLGVASADTLAWRTMSSLPAALSDMATCTPATTPTTAYVSGGCASIQKCTGTSCLCTDVSDAFNSYNIEFDAWTAHAKMPRARYRHVMVEKNGLIYVMGGRDQDDKLVVETDVYNMAKDAWMTHPNMSFPDGGRSDAALFAVGDIIAVTGGYDENYTASASVFGFDPSQEAAWRELAPMLGPRADHGAASAWSRGYVMGGYRLDYCVALSSVEVYDPISNKWIPGLRLPTARSDTACVTSADTIFVLGGEVPDQPVDCTTATILQDVQTFKTGVNSWQSSLPLPTATFRFAAVHVGEGVCVFGGQGPRSGDSHPVVATVSCLRSMADPGTGGNRAGTKLSAGTILCIISLVGMIVYLTCGSIYNKVTTGEERLPHGSFWKGVFGLVLEGCLFTASTLTCGRCGSSATSTYNVI